jgi:YesN/AraC family two-component response regulator
MLQTETAELLSNFFEVIDLAHDGRHGMECYEPGKYDIIITDINMPNMNGVQMVREIRKHDPKQWVIVISAHDESQYLIDLINAGVQQFLSKPLDLEEMLSVLYNLCSELQQQRA